MTLRNATYRAISWLRHRLTAVNTLGHGIHSPYLYDMVRFVFYDDNAYYCFREIEKERRRMLRDSETIDVVDFGTGSSGRRRVADIASSSLKPAREAQLLFRMVNYLRPSVVLELGTSLGVTTAYLAVAAGKGSVLTMEGSGAVAAKASQLFAKLHLTNVQQVVGNIDDTLPQVLQDERVVDFAFVDANHTGEATLRYFGWLADRCGERSVVVVDDIHHSSEMEAAWERLKNDSRVTATMDFYSFGIVFFDKQLMRKNYVLRL